MSAFPETHVSLLVRLKDPGDYTAWNEFVAVYRPVIYRLARKRGLQDSDAQDLSQEVLIAVAKAVGGWKPDPNRGRFRTWLIRIAGNAIINVLTRGRPDGAIGGTSFLEAIRQQAEPNLAAEDIKREYQRELFRWCVKQIRCEFHESTWNAFWLTTVEGLSIEETAARLGKTTGSIYASRSRIMRRLRERVRQYENCDG